MTRIFTKSFRTSSVLGAALGLWVGAAACGGDGRDPAKDAVIAQYVKLVRASYDDTITGAKALRVAVTELLAEPSQKSLDAARQAWVEARPAYLQTEAYRFYEGPIDDAENGREGRINSWPLDEGFIDYVNGAKAGEIIRNGIINDRRNYPDLDKEVLLKENGAAGETSVTVGYHAIEFLLWGQDVSDTGPGNRPFSDYVAGQGASDPDADRRRQYLKLATDLLVEDLEYTREQWNDGEPYVRAFSANARNSSLQNIITGITYLTKDELAEERIRPASETQDQEDEHSCFSDTTDQDMKNDLIGIQNVYFGRYNKDDGQGLEDLVKAADAQLDSQIKGQLAAAEKAIAAIPTPFDQAIKNDGRKLRDAIRALDDLNSSLAKIPETLNL
jgi:putative iron-regulated protein